MQQSQTKPPLWLCRKHNCWDAQSSWGWRAPLEIAKSNPVLKAVSPTGALPGVMPSWGLGICSDRDWTASLGCLWQCSSTPTEGEKTPEVIFFLFKKNVLYFNLCPFTAFASHISLHSQNRFLAKVYSAGKIKNSYKKCTCFSSEGDKVHLSHQPRYLYYWTYHNPYETKIVSYSLQCTWRIPCLYTEIKGIICQWRLE